MVGLAVEVGWVLDIATLKTLLPGFVSMLPWAATGITLGAVSLGLMASGKPSAQAASALPATMLAAIAVIPLLERATGYNAGTDLLLFPSALAVDPTRLSFVPGRMGQAAAFALLTLAGAMLLAPRVRNRVGHAVFSALATTALATGVIALFGYILHLELLDDALLSGHVALHTALAIIALATGVLALRPDAGWIRSAIEQGIAGWTAAGLLGTAALLLLIGSDSATRAGSLANAASGAILRFEELLSTLKDAETGQRGYLLTGQDSYLEPYEMARMRLSQNFAAAMPSPDSDPQPTAALRRLDTLVAAKMAELAETIRLRREGDLAAALAIVETDQGKAIMDEIREEVNGIIHAQVDPAVAGANAARAGAFAFLGTIGLNGLAFWAFGTATRARRVALQTVAEKEARQRELIATIDLGSFIARGMDGVVQHWSEGCERLYGWTSDEAVGRVLHDLLDTKFPVPFVEIEATLERAGEWSGDLWQRTRDGRTLTVTSRKLLRVNADRSKIVLEFVTDVTRQRRAEAALRDSQALLRTVIEAAPGPIYAKDSQGRMVLANSQTLTMIAKPWTEVEGRTDQEFLDDTTQATTIMANDRRVMQTGRAETVEEAFGSDSGRTGVWLSTKTPLADAAGEVTGIVGVSIEVTELKRIEERLRLMVNELNHRVKNTLATVQAIASLTLRSTDLGIRQTFESRLRALSEAHDVLTRENWEGANLHDVIEGVLAPHGGIRNARFHVAGPPLRILPRAAVALSMGLHELATNAAKYGALSVTTGRIAIRWEVTQGDPPGLHIVWSEQGGPPVTTPARRGFGTRLIERGLAQDLGGTVTLAFLLEGLVCTIDAALAEITVPAQVTPFPRVGNMGGD